MEESLKFVVDKRGWGLPLNLKIKDKIITLIQHQVRTDVEGLVGEVVKKSIEDFDNTYKPVIEETIRRQMDARFAVLVKDEVNRQLKEIMEEASRKVTT